MPAAATRRRARVRVEGVVQGVGFRPHVHRIATELGLAGEVRNDARGVELEVEGAPEAVVAFLRRLVDAAPPLARIVNVDVHDEAPTGAAGRFAIGASRGGEPRAPVAPDAATCDDCLAELRDPADRRYRYPFVNCTNCGPRFTIVRGVPYDRPNTTMAGFTMCPDCQAEYDDPADRRFHAQPNACPACGPQARLLDRIGNPVDPAEVGARDAIAATAYALRGGAIVAIKGIGGYHLACRADDEQAVAALRARKRREEKPFALMAPDLATARTLVVLDEAAEAALLSVERPIVLAPRRDGLADVADPDADADAAVAVAVAPRSAELGVMLPYSPLHHLLLADTGATLVLTSGNVSDEPIAYRDDDALARLASIADLFLVHDRPVETRVDDSVVRAARGTTTVLRRSRGYTPRELKLPVAAARPVLACGAELKATCCLARGERAWIGHHIGDLRTPATLASYEEGIVHLARLFDVRPEVVAHDLHPQYLSTAYAESLEGVERVERVEGVEGVELVGVQHHHAHLAACLAEHGATGPALGAIYDGAGYGPGGTVWGGELLAGDLDGFERAGHLLPVRLPGGDAAARDPWRMACAWLVAACGEIPPLPRALHGRVAPAHWEAVARLAASGHAAAPITTSVGRLFDAVAALCGGPLRIAYEGQAAIELEACADAAERGAYEVPVGDDLVLDARPAILAAAADAHAGEHASAISARFHRGLADATVRACIRAAAERGLATAVLSGGAFQNRRLLEQTATQLEQAGLRVLTPRLVPPGDGGVSYGQAAIAAARSAA
ncbi:MAG TPA: carbamoyltransferase HypF [Conexibacter sp.]|jgi:hydrogenase maturation protein HypF